MSFNWDIKLGMDIGLMISKCSAVRLPTQIYQRNTYQDSKTVHHNKHTHNSTAELNMSWVICYFAEH